MIPQNIIKNINEITKFLALRDIQSLSKEEINNLLGKNEVDITLFMGNDLHNSMDNLKTFLKEPVSRFIMFVGGIGHSTENLRISLNKRYNLDFKKETPEADMMAYVAEKYYKIPKEIIIKENASTNTGENVANTFKLLKNENINAENIIVIQDPILQMRSNLTFKKYIADNKSKVQIINFAPFIPNYEMVKEGKAWHMERFFSLITGEIYRLRDEGYGPKGKNFIAKCELPNNIKKAFDDVEKCFQEKNFENRIL